MDYNLSLAYAFTLLILTGLASSCTILGGAIGSTVDARKSKVTQELTPGEYNSLERGNLVLVYTKDQLALQGRYRLTIPMTSETPDGGIMIYRRGNRMVIPGNRIKTVKVIQEKRRALLTGMLIGAAVDAIIFHTTMNNFTLEDR